ncbi:MAG TPA: undecaprenyldiphospho-muramoylpentapeptide beta-N-acetylglucosaminyltransferase [Symbiobacteriaceae bacterium]|nr:undecaprenyldiphospho-muramoylpentapeptide beta-N-acetylglucosaminyltransferase [Symbiobacteriaceae bacterium]
MRYLITGGGTGGHIYPALTIAEALKKLDPEAELLYVGTSTGREGELVPRAGLPFAAISSAGLVGMGLAGKVKGALRTAGGLFQAMAEIRRFKPDLVIGTGGYVSGPVLMAARLLGRPCVIQEQNAFPGVTNRLASSWAKAVFVPYEEAKRIFPASAPIEIVGNPVRREVAAAAREAGRSAFGVGPNEKLLLIVGGSGGAKVLNEWAVEALKLRPLPGVKILHVTGPRYFEAVKKAWGGAPSGVQIEPYLHNMPEALAAADLGLFRSGALTLAEVQVRQLPSVLIPSPNVTHNHQEWNARVLEERGGALVIRETESPAALRTAVERLLADGDLRARMQRALGELAQADAAARIAARCMTIARTGR